MDKRYRTAIALVRTSCYLLVHATSVPAGSVLRSSGFVMLARAAFSASLTDTVPMRIHARLSSQRAATQAATCAASHMGYLKASSQKFSGPIFAEAREGLIRVKSRMGVWTGSDAMCHSRPVSEISSQSAASIAARRRVTVIPETPPCGSPRTSDHDPPAASTFASGA